MVMKRIFFFLPAMDASAYYRCILPARFCKDQLATEGIDLHLTSTLASWENYDAYVFPRIIAKQFWPHLMKIKASGAKIVIGTDDALDKVPAWSSVRFKQDDIGFYQLSLALADYILVSTEPLKQVIGYPEKTTVAPNLIDPSVFPKRPKSDNDPVRILWAGSATHEKDLEQLIEPIGRILEGHKAIFIFFGYIPPEITRRYYGKGVHYFAPVELSHYPTSIVNLAPDIALCPLADEPFNETKSNIKWLEMTLAGAAVIASDFGPYSALRHHHDALTVSPTDAILDDEWEARINSLHSPLDDAPERMRLVKTARERVLDEFSWLPQANRQPWLEFFRRIVAL